MEKILDDFPVVEFAFCYGSAVFEQNGYSELEKKKALVDCIFCVKDVEQFHSANITLNSHHYSSLRYCSYETIAKVQDYGPGLFFIPDVLLDNGMKVKYGVISLDRAAMDLVNWSDLYFSGRLHKPIKIIKNNPIFTAPLRQNLLNACVVSVLMNEPIFTLEKFFHTIVGLSYSGDVRMKFGENPHKVRNIVNSQYDYLMDLYCPLLSDMNGLFYDKVKDIINRETDPETTMNLYHKLPYNVKSYMPIPTEIQKIDPLFFRDHLHQRIRSIVKRSSTKQTLKGIITAGLGKSILYGSKKVLKFLRK